MGVALDITGGVKILDRNLALLKDGSTASASSNDTAAKYLLSNNKYVRWESSGSNDVTTETLTINLSKTRTLDRLFILDHNFKNYSITYNDGTEFTNVSNLDVDLAGGITETGYSKSTTYYKFDAVSVDSVVISVDTTQVANAQKFLREFIATIELGTLAGFPRVQNVKHDRNIREDEVISGRKIIQKGYETTSFNMDFKTYPIQADINLLETIHLKEDSFLVWLCGGRYGTDHFTIEQRGWRIGDVYNMQIRKALGADYAKSIYQNGVDTKVNFIEVV